MEKYDAEGDGDMALMNSLGFKPVKTGERYFISYKTEDTKIVGRIARCLNQKGVPMWYDYYGIEKGKRWETEITKNIRECKAVILFATKNVFGHEDTYLRMEYKIAKRYNKTVYVVWLERPEVDDIHDDLLSWYFEVDELQGLITTTGEESDEIAWQMIEEIPLIHGRTLQPTDSEEELVLGSNFGFEPVKSGERYFICYDREDTERVGHIARALNQRGVPLWYDYGIENGEIWETEINKNVRECKGVILFATRNMFGHKDTYMEKEFELAKYHSKKVHVVWLERPRKEDIHKDLVPWYTDLKKLQGLIVTCKEPDKIAFMMIRDIPLIDGRTPQQPIPIYRKDIGDERRTVHIGDEIPFGRYPQGPKGEVEDLIWRVLDIDETQHRALLITKRLIDGVPYHERYEGITWGNCTLQDWMNGKFMDDAFNEQEKSEIAMVRIDNPDNPIHGIKGGKPTEDKVFALSIEEANKYFKDNGDRMAAVSWYLDNKGIYTISKSNKEYNQDFTIYRLKSGEETGWWWLRSPGITSFDAAHVLPNGDIDEDGHAVNIPGVSVRPALWLKI